MQASSRGLPGMLEFPCDVERLPNGHTLIADAGDEAGYGSEIIEVDPLGNLVWRYGEGLRFAHSAKRLSNGHTLIADTSNDRIIEVTPAGKTVFSSDEWGGGTGTLSDGTHLRYPNDAHQLDDSTLIVTDRNNDRFVIVDRRGQVMRAFGRGIKHPHNCDPLANGHVLLADSDGKRVIEVDRVGEMVWSHGNGDPRLLDWPRDADRLDNGNTLIADSKNSRMLEVTPAGITVWCYVASHFANFYDADKLPDGNVLISDQQHHEVLEVDPFGRVVWRFRNYREPHPIWPRIRNGSFKFRDANGCPEDWILYCRFSEGGGKVIWDETARPRACPGLDYDRHGALCLRQLVAVAPGEFYTLAGSVRAEEIAEGSFAYLQLAFVDKMGGLIEDAAKAPKGNFFSGSCAYTEDSFTAAAPTMAVAVELRFVITGPGRAFVKNMMLLGEE